MHHDLKILPCYYEAIERGDKTFEVRYNGDRGFQAGDTIALREFDTKIPGKISGGYTGRKLYRVITYVTSFEQKDGFVVFSHRQDRHGELIGYSVDEHDPMPTR